MTVVSISKPDSGFDFDWESRMAAVNEVCSEKDPEVWKTCTTDHLCDSCSALASSFKKRLIRAFNAGRESAKPVRVVDAEPVDIGPDVPGGGAA